MARPKNPITPIVETGNGEEFREADKNLRAIVNAVTDEEREINYLMGERAGKRKMARMISKLLTCSDLIDLQQIKTSKKYKGLRILLDGKVLTINTWEEYCVHVEERSVQSVDLELSNFQTLGLELFDAMRQVGIGPGTMRELRKLPEDERALLVQIPQIEDKEEIVEFVETLIDKHAKEKASLTKSRDDAKAEKEEVHNLLAEANQDKAKLRVQAQIIQRMPPDERVQQMRTEVQQIAHDIEEQIRMTLHSAFEQFQQAMPEADAMHHNNVLHDLVQLLDTSLDQICSRLNIPRGTLSGHSLPYMRLNATERAGIDKILEEADADNS
jgi:hypothetical protein